MNFLFLGYGPISSRFLENYVASRPGNKALIVSRHSPGITVDGTTVIDEPNGEGFQDIDVVINSWKSFDSLGKGWEIDFLGNLAKFSKSNLLFVNLSSVAVYGECKSVVDENANLNPINEYGVKKLEFEKYLKNVGLPNLLNLRISNVFGDIRFDDFINRVHAAITQGNSIKLIQPDLVYRDFIHVEQVAKHIHELLFRPIFTSGQRSVDINLCSGSSLTLSAVVQLAEKHFQRSLSIDLTMIEPGTILESRISNKKLIEFNGHDYSAPENQIREYFSQLGF